MNLHVRIGKKQDSETIAEFNRRMAWETEDKKLDMEVVVRAVNRVFDDPRKGFYFVAESENEVVGQLMITFEWSDWRDGWIWWIQSVYVREDHRRKGVFKALYEKVRQSARDEGDVVSLRLYVEKDNTKAQQTYFALGMNDAGYFVYDMKIKDVY